MQHSFSITFTVDELACIVSNYSGSYTDQIDCGKFLNEFFRLIAEKNSKNTKYQTHISQRCDKDERIYLDNFIEKMASCIPISKRQANVKEMKSAYEKLNNISSFHKPDIFHNYKKYFDGIDLSPKLFHKFLLNSFQINLSIGELNATINVFDLNKDGLISYSEFMSTFHLLGLEERSRRILKQKSDEQVNLLKRKEKTLRRFDVFNQDIKSHIIWPVLPRMTENHDDSNDNHGNNDSDDNSNCRNNDYDNDDNDYEHENGNEMNDFDIPSSLSLPSKSRSQSRRSSRISRICSPRSPSLKKHDLFKVSAATKVIINLNYPICSMLTSQVNEKDFYTCRL